jgi:hypothetical protein
VHVPSAQWRTTWELRDYETSDRLRASLRELGVDAMNAAFPDGRTSRPALPDGAAS